MIMYIGIRLQGLWRFKASRGLNKDERWLNALLRFEEGVKPPKPPGDCL